MTLPYICQNSHSIAHNTVQYPSSVSDKDIEVVYAVYSGC